MSSISRRRNGLMALSVIGAPVLGEVFAPRSQDRTPVSATLRDPSLATNYRGSGLVLRRDLAVRHGFVEGRLTTPCSHSRLVETIDRARPRANGSNRPSAVVHFRPQQRRPM